MLIQRLLLASICSCFTGSLSTLTKSAVSVTSSCRETGASEGDSLWSAGNAVIKIAKIAVNNRATFTCDLG